jgi:uncharacterized coiled-coil protein SlyX
MDGKDIKEALKQIPELIKTLKAKFSDEKSKEKFTMEWKLKDGSMIQTEDPTNGDDGKIDAGDIVMIVGADGKTAPAPDGELILEDGTKITIAGGIIVTAEPGSPDDNGKTDPAAGEMSAQFKAEIEKIVKPLTDRITQLEEKNAAQEKTIKAQVEKMSKVNEIQKETFAIVEKIAALPKEDAAGEKNKFSFKKQDKIQELTEAIKNLKK